MRPVSRIALAFEVAVEHFLCSMNVLNLRRPLRADCVSFSIQCLNLCFDGMRRLARIGKSFSFLVQLRNVLPPCPKFMHQPISIQNQPG
ncbi:hypothetical protein AQ919_18140 [Burkholderia pseudomallei]|nr:hypothetical protein AQ919_18140 [Burkholderia pseudomallei]ONC69450.1 hypothetical protein AQ921_21260 [Burkholderia pseudomallei]